MSLNEYWKSFVACLPAPLDGDIPTALVPLIAAGYEASIPPEQLLKFHIQFLKIKDVSSRLSVKALEANKIEEIFDAYNEGCVYSKDVIIKLFTVDEVLESYHSHFFPDNET